MRAAEEMMRRALAELTSGYSGGELSKMFG
jgi:hypothetical protein